MVGSFVTKLKGIDIYAFHPLNKDKSTKTLIKTTLRSKLNIASELIL